MYAVEASVAHEVTDREYARLLGLPRHRALDGDLGERAFSAREWYARHGRPFAMAVRHEVTRLGPDIVVLDNGSRLSSRALSTRVATEASRSLAVVAVTAGPEIDEETTRLWADGRPDEAFFLDRLGAAIVERLIDWTAIAICRRVGTENLTATTALRPGCSDWDLADQHTLFELFAGVSKPMVMLESAMMAPKNSMLGAVVLTTRRLAATPADSCRSCDLTPCAFRRVPFDQSGRPRLSILSEVAP